MKERRVRKVMTKKRGKQRRRGRRKEKGKDS